jgi:AAA domain
MQPRDALPDGVTPLYKDSDRPSDHPRAVDAVMQHRWCAVLAPPAAIYRMVKDRWPDSLFGHELYDCLVLDEASQMNLPEAMMAALPLKPAGHLIVVGDPRQMPPIVKHEWATEPRRTFQEFRSYESLFLALLALEPPMIKFSESFRLHADMAEFLRAEIYAQDGIAYHSNKHMVLPSFAHPDPFVAAVLAPAHALVVVVHDEAQSQQRNTFEQALIAPLLEVLADPATFHLDPEHGLGVVVPHRAQRAALQEALPCLARQDPQTGTVRRSAVDTVERFQGGEREVILVSATESEPQYVLASSAFLLDPRRLTVALSRAERKMILVASRSVFTLFSADEETFAHAQLWKNLLRRACTVRLWDGERDGRRVTVWGNAVASQGGACAPRHG